MADHGTFSGDEEKPTRPVSSYDYGNYEKDDYGPLIIDSVVQPVVKEKKGKKEPLLSTPMFVFSQRAQAKGRRETKDRIEIKVWLWLEKIRKRGVDE